MSSVVRGKEGAVVPPRRHLNGPVWDFLLLGGGSLLALLALNVALGETAWAIAWSTGMALAIANVINNPHFMHSYQLFYRGFGAKVTTYPKDLRLRYWLCGIVVPFGLAAFMAWAVITGHPRALGQGANLMFFLVGWHYVKQGYGIAMVDAALKQAYYSDAEKSALLRNAYAVWMLSWLMINHVLSGAENLYWGIQYLAIPIPESLAWLAGAAAIACGMEVAWRLMLRYQRGDSIAWNGLVAYAVSSYIWLLVFDPVLVLWIPMFHSLQYLAVVWRYERNRTDALYAKAILRRVRFAAFYALSLVLGYLAFWWLPRWLNAHVGYDHTLFGSELFLFLFWVFINVHHYFMDTVLWRKGNPDVQKYLFAHVRKG